MQKRWSIKELPDNTAVEQIRSTLKVDRIVAVLLLQRGISTYEDAEVFFRPKLENLHDPFLMAGMKDAVKLLSKAIDHQEQILLYGDYDVDGTTSVAMMYSFLKERARVDFYIPDRYSEGYGVSEQGIDYAIENGVKLMITLDCGIKANEKLARARQAGIDVIVCDHHTPGEALPNAVVLDPKRKDCDYPFKELSGCGVGFKLLQAYCLQAGISFKELFSHLDFLAISIGADIVDVTGENRILAYHGMKVLNEQPRSAFKTLVQLAARAFPLTLTDVVFTIAPRINAAGRLRSGNYAVQLMVSDDLDEIRNLAMAIEQDNRDRKQLDNTITEEALLALKGEPEDRFSNVVAGSNWHKGVVGIVASRVIETFYKPTIIFATDGEYLTGSARSVPGVDVYEALLECEDILVRFGGHKYAAGLTIHKDHFDQFKSRFEGAISAVARPELRSEEVLVDLEVNFGQLFDTNEDRMKLPRLKRVIDQFEPFGPGNMKPVFMSTNVYSVETRLLKEAHLKVRATQPPHDLNIDCIGFGMANHEDDVASGVPFDIAYTLENNNWNGKTTLQLNLKDVRPTI